MAITCQRCVRAERDTGMGRAVVGVCEGVKCRTYRHQHGQPEPRARIYRLVQPPAGGRELQADELQAAGTGWALFVYTIQNLPLAGRLGTISAWMLHKDSVGPSGFLVSRSPDEECAVSLGLYDY